MSSSLPSRGAFAPQARGNDTPLGKHLFCFPFLITAWYREWLVVLPFFDGNSRSSAKAAITDGNGTDGKRNFRMRQIYGLV